MPADPAAAEAGTASEPPIEMMAGGMASMAEDLPQAEDPTKDPLYVGGFSSAHSGGTFRPGRRQRSVPERDD